MRTKLKYKHTKLPSKSHKDIQILLDKLNKNSYFYSLQNIKFNEILKRFTYDITFSEKVNQIYKDYITTSIKEYVKIFEEKILRNY